MSHIEIPINTTRVRDQKRLAQFHSALKDYYDPRKSHLFKENILKVDLNDTNLFNFEFASLNQKSMQIEENKHVIST